MVVYADRHGVRAEAEAFLDFLHGPEAQEVFARHGFRPVDNEVLARHRGKFPPVADLWTVEDLGGWPKILEEIYGPQGLWTKVFSDKSGSK